MKDFGCPHGDQRCGRCNLYIAIGQCAAEGLDYEAIIIETLKGKGYVIERADPPDRPQ
jgi:hypothetical protein